MKMVQTFPVGYSLIPGGELHGKKVSSFGMKNTPVTVGEWKQDASNLGEDRYISLHHNWKTGKTSFGKQGRSVEEVLGGPIYSPDLLNLNKGDVLVFGSMILLKMVDNPSTYYEYEGGKGTFSRPNQPVVGVSYFYAKAWCFLKTALSGGRFVYDLPTDLQYEYVASDRGTKRYGTETGTLMKGKRKLAHIDVCKNGEWVPASVKDRRYVQKLPFGVQTTGNVWRLIRYNPKYKKLNKIFPGPYGLRGGSVDSVKSGSASHRRGDYEPITKEFNIGFSPIISSSAKKPSGRGKPAPRPRV